MGGKTSTAFRALSLLAIMIVASLMFASSGKATSLGLAATPRATPQEGGESGVGTPQAPDVSFDSKQAGAAPTLKDLQAKYSMLNAYLEKIDDIDDPMEDVDFKDLYGVLAMIYKDFGAAGVSIFLEESELDWALNVPLPYFDVFEAFEAGGFDKVIEQAKELKLLNDKGELVGYLALEEDDQQQAVSDAVKKLGISVYEYDKDEGVLEIGIPTQILIDLKTPDEVLKFWTSIGSIEGVDEFFAPEPELSSTK
jgi:hypothetical protein